MLVLVPKWPKNWRGSIVLTFAEVPESCPPYRIRRLLPSYEICMQSSHISCTSWIQIRANGATEGFFASIGASLQTELGVWIMWSDDVATTFYGALAAAAEFAIDRAMTGLLLSRATSITRSKRDIRKYAKSSSVVASYRPEPIDPRCPAIPAPSLPPRGFEIPCSSSTSRQRRATFGQRIDCINSIDSRRKATIVEVWRCCPTRRPGSDSTSSSRSTTTSSSHPTCSTAACPRRWPSGRRRSSRPTTGARYGVTRIATIPTSVSMR